MSVDRIRYYLSVCTFGYSAVWWDWPRWEQEIEWMADHGINMPLALTGQELIWQRVFRALGLTDAEVRAFFSGPAYLPWHRLGNLDGYLGPLSQGWIDRQAVLQHRILGLERERGMAPVVPGFSGFVPDAFAAHYPNVRLQSAEPWAGFAPTTYIDPLDPMFVEVGALFIEKYRNEFGTDHHYLCETFAEQLPRIAPGHECGHLRAIGAATWESLYRADEDAHWVMQGWPFHFGRDFWTPERGQALFEAVPDGRLIVLDQVTETYEVWRNTPSVCERGWVHCAVHNYGQNTHLHGDLAGFAERAWAAQSSPNKGNMLGMGMVPEGIDQNPVVYELLTDLMRATSKIEVSEWIEGYARSRYNSDHPAAIRAWKLLLGSVYGPNPEQTLRYSWRYRPGDQPILTDIDLPAIRLAVESLMEASDELTANDNFRRDLVDVAKTWLGGIADLMLEDALGDSGKQTDFLSILPDLDRLMATRPEHRLSTWIKAARSAADSPAEADLFEHNARSLITHWGGPFLFDYAIREWAGLIQDFHAKRWGLYFSREEDDALHVPLPWERPGEGKSQANWEQTWASSTARPEESAPGDPIEIVRSLLAKYPHRSAPRTTSQDLGLFSLKQLEEIDLGEPRVLCGIAVYPMFGQGFMGSYAIQIGQEIWHAHHKCRGARASFEPEEVRHIRIEVRGDLGDSSQQFQLLVFSPSIR